MELRSTIDDDQRAILDQIRAFTMTSVERQVALLDSVDHVHASATSGAFVECGVWRGGSVLAMILRLRGIGAPPRHLYLYDTFEGMTRPTEADTSEFHEDALATWTAEDGRPWRDVFGPESFEVDSVRSLLLSTGYPSSHLHFVVGDIEETLPATIPDDIALLRLDTDWYESTRHELTHLYPRLSIGGVLIVDDYGHWQGSRAAVDEYFADRPRPLLLAVDYTCRVGVKERA